MTEDSRGLNSHPEHEIPSSEEILSVKDIVQSMLRAVKALKIYLPNNPVLTNFVEEWKGKMVGHIALYSEFELEVGLFTLAYKTVILYENHASKDNFVYRMFSDGIRLLRFDAGVEAHELTAFLGIVGFEHPNHDDDDIVTQLWESALPHITSLLAEDFGDFDLEEEDEETSGFSQQETISLILADVAGNSRPLSGTIPRHLLMLTAEEVEWLRQVKQAEADRDPLDNVVKVLASILAGAKDLELFADFMVIIADLIVKQLLAGEVGTVLRLVRVLAQLVKLDNQTPEQRQMVRDALAGVLNERSVGVLQEVLDSGESVSREELQELLQILGPPSLGAICELLGRTEKLKTRKVIIEVLVEFGGDDPQIFAPFLSDPRWYLVRNVVLVLSLIDAPVALEMIVGLISHKESRIRKEVLSFIERSPDPKAKNYLLKFLRDESSAIRIRALQILGRGKLSFALKPTLALTVADDFKTKDLAEKKVVYETIAELGAEQMIPLYRDMLLKKQWFKKNVDKNTAICAVAGLLKIRNEESLRLLEEARKQHTLEIRGVIDHAISIMSTVSEAPFGNAREV